jgi:hypothetical protein
VLLAVNYLVPTLERSGYFKRVVLAPTRCRDLSPAPPYKDVECRVNDAHDVVADDPGDWLYIAVHSNAGAGCTNTFYYMEVLYPSANEVATELATLFCRHVVDGYAVNNGYKQQEKSSCLSPRPLEGKYKSMEVNPSTMGSLPSILVELGFYDSIADLTWWNAHRQGVANAFLTMLKARDGGAQPWLAARGYCNYM